MKRFIPYLFTVLVVFTGIVSCTKEPYITPGSSQSISLEAGSASSEFVFSTNYDWTARSSESWLSVSPASGSAGENIKIKISAAENSGYDVRSATVMLSAGEATQTITVQQAEKKGFQVTGSTFSIGKDGGNVTIPVKANVTYTCAISENATSWLSVSQTKALSNYTIILLAAKNESYDARTGTVTVAYESQSVTVTVTQSQKDELIVTQQEYEIGSKGGELKVPVSTNIEYTCSVMEGAKDWISITNPRTKGLEDYNIVLQVAENKYDASRVGQVKITGAGKESFITITQGVDEDLQKQRPALMALYNALNGDQWINKDNWGSDKPLGQWYGVTADAYGFVTRLELLENNLSGTLPPEIGDLVKLTALNLGYNYGIGGNIPAEIGTLNKLGYLNLYGNELTGGIPEELYSLSELYHLDLGVNKLSGELSPKIAGLSKLTSLWLHYNNFSGSLPKELGQMNLIQVGLYNNSFSGSLPDELGTLNNLTIFNLAANNFSGIIPISILNNPNIWDKFWGTITAWNNFDLSTLTYFPAPDFTFNDVEGNSINLGEEYTANQYTILYSWQSWCPYATAFHPALISLYNQYKSKGLDVIGYSNLDQIYVEMGMTDQMLKEIAGNLGMPWRTIFLTGKYQDAYYSMMTQGGSPSVHVVDKIGNIVFSTLTFADSYNDLGTFLEERLGPGSGHSYYASTDYSADGTIRTYQTHTAGEGIKLIFTGDAFTDKDHADGSFDNRMNQAVEAFFSEEPYTSLRDRFDVYSVAAVSKNREITDDSETAFSTYFGAGTKVGGDDDAVFHYALKVPGVDLTETLVSVVINSPNYSGTCYMYEDNAAIGYSTISGYSEAEFAKLIRHESGGHGFGKLLDEYAYSGTIPASAKNEFIHQRDELGWGGNVDVTSDPAKIQWSVMLSDSRYKDVVGIYEGALTYASGAWRPTHNSIMHLNTGGYNAPSRFAIYKRIIRLSENREASFEEFATFDAPNLGRPTAAVAAVEKYEPLAPPVFVKGSWKDAKKK
ncbi:MAG: BACON domain-containing carbohydrate-binding protein [Bacteroidales bacterium]